MDHKDLVKQFVMPAAVFEGPDFIITASNAAWFALVGDRGGAAMGKPIAEAFPELVGQGIIEILAKVAASGESVQTEEQRIVLDLGHGPEERFFQAYYMAVRESGVPHAGVLAFGLDVTGLVRGRALLQARNEELEAFASRVNHELKSPLGVIVLRLHRITSREIDTQTAHDVEKIRSAITLIVGMLDELLAFAQAASRIPGVASPWTVIHEVIDELRNGGSVKFEVKAEQGAEAWRVGCSPIVVHSIYSNLVRNAIKFMNRAATPDRRITTRLRPVSNAAIRVEVEDTGPGVPARLQDTIFEPHVRGYHDVPGLGLGLAIVKKFAESHGGRVGFYPKESGSVFWFELPISLGGV